MTRHPGPDPGAADDDRASTNRPPTAPQAQHNAREPWGAREWPAASRRRRGGGLVAGLVLLLIGTYLLVRQAMPAIDADRAWPYGVVAIGLLLLVAAVVAPER